MNDVNLPRGQAKNTSSELEFNDWSLQEAFDSERAEYVKSGFRGQRSCAIAQVPLRIAFDWPPAPSRAPTSPGLHPHGGECFNRLGLLLAALFEQHDRLAEPESSLKESTLVRFQSQQTTP